MFLAYASIANQSCSESDSEEGDDDEEEEDDDSKLTSPLEGGSESGSGSQVRICLAFDSPANMVLV